MYHVHGSVRVHSRNLAVLLIDMQRVFVGRLSQENRRKLIPAQKEVLQLCAKLDIPVANFQLKGKDGKYGPTIGSLSRALKRVPRHVTIDKWYDDAFEETKLQETLQLWGTASLIIMGMNKSFCVWQTAQTALTCGYVLHTTPSLIADSEVENLEPHSGDWYTQNGVLASELQVA